MLLRTRYTILEKIFICSLIMLHLSLILPLSEIFPLPKTVTRPEALADGPANNPPVINYINNISVKDVSSITLEAIDEGDTLIIKPQAYDPDGDSFNITFENLVRLPEGTPIFPDGFRESGGWVTTYIDAGSYKTTVSADDLKGGVATKEVYFTINDKDASPVVSISLSKNTVYPNETFNIHVELDDADVEDSTGDVSQSGHSISYIGTAHIDASKKRFGNGSLSIDGDDYVSIADSADWDIVGSNTDNWTIDFWVYADSVGGTDIFIEHWQDVNNRWLLYNNSGILSFILYRGDSAIIQFSGGTLATKSWHHIALCKVGSKYGIYYDGNQVAYRYDTDTADFTGNLYIGAQPDGGYGVPGFMDEVRISHANEFAANPNSGLTNKIAVPTQKYILSRASPSFYDTKLLLHFDEPDGNPFEPTLLKDGTPFGDTTDIPPYIYGSGSFDKKYSINTPGLYTITARMRDTVSAATYEASACVEVIDTSAGANDVFPISGDFNGDGLTDVGTFAKKTGQWKVALSDNGEFDNVRLWLDNFKGDDVEQAYSTTGDFNGDGRTDAVLYKRNGGEWKFAFSDGERFVYDASRDITKFGGGECDPLIGDFNGDGITDIGYSVPKSTDGDFYIKLAKKDKTGFGNTAISYQTNLGGSTTYSGDFNGDGLADISSFKYETGNWYVAFSRDAASSQLTDRVQDEGGSGTSEYSQNGGPFTSASEPHNKTIDGDFHTCFEVGRAGDSAVEVHTELNFASPQEITKVVFKAWGAGFSDGSNEGRIDVDLYYGGNWHNIYHEYDNVAGSENGSGTSVTGDWTGVGKIRVWVWARGASMHGDTCTARIYEIQAWGPSGMLETNDGLPAFTEGTGWISGFGPYKNPVLTDYNHDGKTDIGYFDGSTGEWHYALSDGTKFNEAAGASWPTSFGQGSDILPSGGDYNGDGIGDAAIFHKNRQGVLNKWEIKLHSSKQPDLLVSVDNGIGGTTNIEYDVSTRFDNTGSDDKSDLPFPVQVVKRVIKTDGMGNNYQINYEYEGGMFDTDTREFRGFKYVKVTDSEGTVNETYFNQDDIYKGRPHEERISDLYGKVYSFVQYEWESILLHSGLARFPYLVSKTTTLYNTAEGASRDIKTVYSNYDGYGNAGRIDELGFVDAPSDDRYTIIEYEYNTAAYIVGKPKHTAVKRGSATVSETWYTYDSLGSLKTETKWLDSGPNPVTKFKYDYEVNPSVYCGNIVEVEDALGRKTTTEYSSVCGYTFLTKVTNTLSHSQRFAYDYKTGQIVTSIDPNSQITRTAYDGFGRVAKIIGPYDTEASPGIEYFYDLIARPVKVTAATKVDTGIAASSYAFIDGLGRTIEVKTEAEDEVGNPCQIVSGIAKFDSRGQVKERYLPYFTAASPSYVAPTYSQSRITYEYDPVGRVIQTIMPDGASSYAQYGGWIFTTVDENGSKIKSENDAYGRLIKVHEYNAGSEYITEYKYDALGNLITTIDAQGNATVMTYDSLGRKIAMDDPDMGNWTYQYDAVGNITSQTDAKGQTVTFQYDSINRLNTKSTSVTYEYDKSGTSDLYYRVGRLRKVTDLSGTTEFFYDRLGREVKTVKTLDPSLRGEAEAISYIIERTYDALDRLKTVKYPDGEVVTYAYNKAGGIEKVTGNQSYVTNVDYNANGQMTKIDYGDGTHTSYTYNIANLRLTNLTTDDGRGTNIQNLSYTFDGAGNVLSITDNSASGTNTQAFQYDDLNRLIKATGETYQTINYAYDSIGNMISRTSLRGAGGDEAISYTYGENAGPHAVTSYQLSTISYQLDYDANGNMLSKECEGRVRNFEYDIENRLIEVTEPKEEYVSNYEIPLTSGWNFVSIPVITAQDIAPVLQNSGIPKAQVARYDAETQTWQHFVYEEGQDLSRFNQFTEFEYGRGYQIYVESNCILKVSGATPITERSLTLYPGWNLISAPTTSSISAADALPGVTYDSIVAASSLRGAQSAEAISYNPVTTLEGGNSYFIKVQTQQAWNIPKQEDKTTYLYDGDGGRVKKTSPGHHVTTSPEETTYIGSSYELVTRDSELVTKKHIFLGSTRICTVDRGLSTVDYHYYHPDHIGSSNVVTDKDGNIAQLLEYDPYGLTNREEGSYNTDCRFTGKLFDTSSELYYYGARYYDPGLGRFIQPDTIVPYPSDPQSFNRYAYARNNPIRYVDPTGHSFLAVLSTIFAIIAAVAETVAVVAGVGAMIAAATGHADAAKTLGNIAMIAAVVALAASTASNICNVLATPSPPGAYSDLTKLDSKTLSEVTGYNELPNALADQPLLEAGGSGVTQGKAVAENAQFFTETLGLSPESAKVASAQVTTVNIGHTATLGEAQAGGFRIKSVMKFGTYTGEGLSQISIMDFTTGEYENLYKQFVLFGENFYMGSTSSGGLSFSFAGNSITIGGGSIVSFSRGIEAAGFYSSVETSMSFNVKSIRNTFDSISTSLNAKPSYSPYLKGVPIFRPPQLVFP